LLQLAVPQRLLKLLVVEVEAALRKQDQVCEEAFVDSARGDNLLARRVPAVQPQLADRLAVHLNIKCVLLHYVVLEDLCRVLLDQLL